MFFSVDGERLVIQIFIKVEIEREKFNLGAFEFLSRAIHKLFNAKKGQRGSPLAICQGIPGKI